MRKLFTTTIVFIGLSVSLYGQQDPQFTQNMFNRVYANPAAAGNADAFCATLLYRTQWVSYDGAPKTGVFTIDGPIRPLNMGVGLTVLSDQVGYEKTLSAKLALDYRLNIGAASKLSFGIDLGYLQKSLDGTKFNPNDPNDPVIPTGSVKGSVIPDIGAGIYFNSEKFYAGISASHLTEGNIDLDVVNYKLTRHIYAMAGYKFELTPTLALTPSIFAKNDGTTTQFDINAMLHINNRFWGGVSYRYQDAVALLLGLNIIDNLKLGYSYDFTTSELNKYSNGSHEIMLNYCINPKKPMKYRVRNVLYL